MLVRHGAGRVLGCPLRACTHLLAYRYINCSLLPLLPIPTPLQNWSQAARPKQGALGQPFSEPKTAPPGGDRISLVSPKVVPKVAPAPDAGTVPGTAGELSARRWPFAAVAGVSRKRPLTEATKQEAANHEERASGLGAAQKASVVGAAQNSPERISMDLNHSDEDASADECKVAQGSKLPVEAAAAEEAAHSLALASPEKRQRRPSKAKAQSAEAEALARLSRTEAGRSRKAAVRVKGEEREQMGDGRRSSAAVLPFEALCEVALRVIEEDDTEIPSEVDDAESGEEEEEDLGGSDRSSCEGARKRPGAPRLPSVESVRDLQGENTPLANNKRRGVAVLAPQAKRSKVRARRLARTHGGRGQEIVKAACGERVSCVLGDSENEIVTVAACNCELSHVSHPNVGTFGTPSISSC